MRISAWARKPTFGCASGRNGFSPELRTSRFRGPATAGRFWQYGAYLYELVFVSSPVVSNATGSSSTHATDPGSEWRVFLVGAECFDIGTKGLPRIFASLGQPTFSDSGSEG